MIYFPGYPWVDSVPFSASNHTPGFTALQWSSSLDKQVRTKLPWRSPSVYTHWSLYLSCKPHPETSGRILGYFIRWFRSALMMNISVNIYIGCAVTFDSVYCYSTRINLTLIVPDSKVREANMGPIWGRLDPGGPPCWPHELCYLGWSTETPNPWHWRCHFVQYVILLHMCIVHYILNILYIVYVANVKNTRNYLMWPVVSQAPLDQPVLLIRWMETWINTLRPSDACIRQQFNHHWHRPADKRFHYLKHCWNMVRNKL